EQVSHSLQERKLELQVAPDAEDQDAWPPATQEGHTFSEVARVTQRPLLLPRLLLQHRRQERVVLVDKHLRVSHGGNDSEPDRTLPRSDAAAPTTPPTPIVPQRYPLTARTSTVANAPDPLCPTRTSSFLPQGLSSERDELRSFFWRGQDPLGRPEKLAK